MKWNRRKNIGRRAGRPPPGARRPAPGERQGEPPRTGAYDLRGIRAANACICAGNVVMSLLVCGLWFPPVVRLAIMLAYGIPVVYFSRKCIRHIPYDEGRFSLRLVFGRFLSDFWGFILFPVTTAAVSSILGRSGWNAVFVSLLFGPGFLVCFYESLVLEHAMSNRVYRKGSWGYNISVVITFVSYYFFSSVVLFDSFLRAAGVAGGRQ